MSHAQYGHVVDSCPANETDFAAAATRLNCTEDKFGRNQYTCVPRLDLSAVVEFCYNRTVGIYPKGEYKVTSEDQQIRVHGILYGSLCLLYCYAQVSLVDPKICVSSTFSFVLPTGSMNLIIFLYFSVYPTMHTNFDSGLFRLPNLDPLILTTNFWRYRSTGGDYPSYRHRIPSLVYPEVRVCPIFWFVFPIRRMRLMTVHYVLFHYCVLYSLHKINRYFNTAVESKIWNWWLFVINAISNIAYMITSLYQKLIELALI
jgi:hypothetical protein